MRFRTLLIAIMLGALVLSACGGAPAAPTAAPEPTAAPAEPTAAPAEPTAAPAPPTPTFESVTDLEPTVGAEPAPAATGALAWRDQILRNDQVVVSISGLEPLEDGQVYAAWLSGEDASLPLGALQDIGGVQSLTFVAPAQENLLGGFDRVYITMGADPAGEIANVQLAGALPAQALVHIRHVLVSIGVTPGKIGFALGLRQEVDELLRHAQFLKDALDAGDLALEKVHAEHIANIIDGSGARDLNGDGRIQNPGDGFGLIQNGQQDGYIKGMIDHARLAAEAGDATDAIKLHAGHVQIAGENTRARVEQIHELADKISQAGSVEETQQDVLTVLALAQQAIHGVDVNNDEQVGPVPGEGGVLTAYQHAQLMASIPLAAAPEAPAAPAPVQQAPTIDEITIEISDNTFTPNKITIPIGTKVTWTSAGQLPHTVTADDGSFDSGRLDNGGSFSFTFEQAGTFPYYCTFHGGKGGEGMSGAIIVAEQSAAAQPAPAPAAPAPAPAASELQVAIGDNTYTPADIEVPAGTKVVWTNQGQRPHTVTADDNAFKSDTLQNGGTFEQTFDAPGVYPYYCEFHGGPGGQAMAAVIRVVAADGHAQSHAATPVPTPAPPPTPAPAPTAAPPAALTVSMRDFEFATPEIRVKAGTTVTWTNDGAKQHSATAVDKSFDTGLYGAGEARSVTFSQPGTFTYYCELHGAPDGSAGMVGVVVVEP